MHEGNVTLFLVSVVVIAATPFVLLGVELVRRARTRRRSAPTKPPGLEGSYVLSSSGYRLSFC